MSFPSKAILGCVTCYIFCLLFSPGLWAQDFISINRDLRELEILISDTLSNTEEQQKQLEYLKNSLDASGKLIETCESIIAGQESSLRDLQVRLNEMSEIYRKQSSLSVKYEKSSRFWKASTLIGIPAAALFSGCLVWALTR